MINIIKNFDVTPKTSLYCVTEISTEVGMLTDWPLDAL